MWGENKQSIILRWKSGVVSGYKKPYYRIKGGIVKYKLCFNGSKLITANNKTYYWTINSKFCIKIIIIKYKWKEKAY